MDLNHHFSLMRNDKSTKNLTRLPGSGFTGVSGTDASRKSDNRKMIYKTAPIKNPYSRMTNHHYASKYRRDK